MCKIPGKETMKIIFKSIHLIAGSRLCTKIGYPYGHRIATVSGISDTKYLFLKEYRKLIKKVG